MNHDPRSPRNSQRLWLDNVVRCLPTSDMFWLRLQLYF